MSSVRESIDRLSDLELLETLAFRYHDYTPDALTTIRETARSRGFTNANIQTYREERLTVDQIDAVCQSCSESLHLGRQDLVRGQYTCPECGFEQPVDHSGLPHRTPADDDRRAEIQKAPKGVRGWLILIAIAIVIELWMAMIEGYGAVIGNGSVLTVTLLCWLPIVVVTFLFVNKNRMFPLAFIAYCALNLALAGIDMVRFSYAPEAVNDVITRSVYSAICILYVLASKRVKATFAHSMIDHDKDADLDASDDAGVPESPTA